MKCIVCELWGIDRTATHLGMWANGDLCPTCDGCHSAGAGWIPGYTPDPIDEHGNIIDKGTDMSDSPKNELIRIRGPRNRVIKWSKVSSVQYLGYFIIKGAGEHSIAVFEYEPGVFTAPDLHNTYDSLESITTAILNTHG